MSKKSSKKKSNEYIEAQIVSYRRNNRLQTENQAIAKLLTDYNPASLVGKKFLLEFEESDALAKGKVTDVHGQPKKQRVLIRFSNKGMTAHALNQVIKIFL
ncbi:MAG: hypothetical protein U9O98_09060 [Asgard group archaeon]|nr:hypothetical protein [Asgard group archaeon]